MLRGTFYGCIAHAARDHPGEEWHERLFRIHYSRELNSAETSRFLDTVAEAMNDAA